MGPTVNTGQQLNKLGGQTPKNVVYKFETHKLTHSFPVAKDAVIVAGQLLYLNGDGEVLPYGTADVTAATNDPKYIGISLTDSKNPCYAASKQYGKAEVTVMLTGHAIVYGVCGTNAINAGDSVFPTSKLDSTGNFPVYQTADAAHTNRIAIALGDAAAGAAFHILIL